MEHVGEMLTTHFLVFFPIHAFIVIYVLYQIYEIHILEFQRIEKSA